MKIEWFRPMQRMDLVASEACSETPKQNFPLTLARHLRLYSQMVPIKVYKPLPPNVLEREKHGS